MIQKVKDFFQKYRTIVLRLLDVIQGIFILLLTILPDSKIRNILAGIFIILYGGTTARYYLPKK